MCRAYNREMEVKYDLTPSPRAAATSTSACEANRRVMAGEAEPDPAAERGRAGPPSRFRPPGTVPGAEEIFTAVNPYGKLFLGPR
jgi:hypothetical protein